MVLTESILGGRALGAAMLVNALVQLLVGLVAGAGIGFAGRWLLLRLRLPAGGLYPVVALALAFVAFGVPTLIHGSGFLAVYVTGIVLGNGPIPYRPGVQRVSEAVAWLSQILMFLTFGLLVFPSRLLAVAGVGVAIALFLAIVARPLAVMLCLAPFRFPLRGQIFVGWAGLRGAVPIVLSIYPVLRGVSGAAQTFNIVFFVVVLSTLLQGKTLRWVARRLGLEETAPAATTCGARDRVAASAGGRAALILDHARSRGLGARALGDSVSGRGGGDPIDSRRRDAGRRGRASAAGQGSPLRDLPGGRSRFHPAALRRDGERLGSGGRLLGSGGAHLFFVSFELAQGSCRSIFAPRARARFDLVRRDRRSSRPSDI